MINEPIRTQYHGHVTHTNQSEHSICLSLLAPVNYNSVVKVSEDLYLRIKSKDFLGGKWNKLQSEKCNTICEVICSRLKQRML